MSNVPNFNQIVQYFETLASEHVELKHTDGEKHFYRFELDEVLTGMPGEINYPALILEGYRFDFSDRRSDNPMKRRSGAFILVSNISDPGDYDLIHNTWDELEVIADDILARIAADKRLPSSPVRAFDLDSVEGTLVATEFGNLYGLRITFALSSPFPTNVNPSKWISNE